MHDDNTEGDDATPVIDYVVYHGTTRNSGSLPLSFLSHSRLGASTQGRIKPSESHAKENDQSLWFSNHFICQKFVCNSGPLHLSIPVATLLWIPWHDGLSL